MAKLKKNNEQTGYAAITCHEKRGAIKELPKTTRQQLQMAIRGLEQHGVRDYVVKVWKY